MTDEIQHLPDPHATAPPMWNPAAAANWSVLFCVPFGSFLHARNWKTLGKPTKARNAYAWFAVTLTLTFLGMLTSRAATSVGIWLWSLLLWYFISGRTQTNYVRDQFGHDYPRKSFAWPVVAGLTGFVVLTVLSVVVAAVADAGKSLIAAATSTSAGSEFVWDHAVTPADLQSPDNAGTKEMLRILDSHVLTCGSRKFMLFVPSERGRRAGLGSALVELRGFSTAPYDSQDWGSSSNISRRLEQQTSEGYFIPTDSELDRMNHVVGDMGVVLSAMYTRIYPLSEAERARNGLLPKWQAWVDTKGRIGRFSAQLTESGWHYGEAFNLLGIGFTPIERFSQLDDVDEQFRGHDLDCNLIASLTNGA